MNLVLKALITIGVLFFSFSSVHAQTVKQDNDQGLTYLKQGNANAAVTEFSKAIQEDHTNAVAYINRALAYVNLGRLPDAISDSTQAI